MGDFLSWLWAQREVVLFVLTVVLGLVSVWLQNGRDLEATKKAVAKMVGDALAELVKFSQAQMGAVTDDQVYAIAGIVYDKGVMMLPDKLEPLVRALYSRVDFQIIVLRVWREYQARSQVYEAPKQVLEAGNK